MKEITIKTEYIKLDSFLKYAGLVSTGGEAKSLISSGRVKILGESCTKRGKKLTDGTVLCVDDEEYKVLKT